MRNKISFIFITFLLSLALFGCESNDNNSNYSPPDTNEEQNQEEENEGDGGGGETESEKEENETPATSDVLLLPVIAEAEGGAAAVLASQGDDVLLLADVDNSTVGYITAAVNAVEPPESFDDARVVALDITFPEAGDYQILTRFRVGPDGFSDDSFYIYIPSGEGSWQLLNSLSGFSIPGAQGYEEGAVVADPGGNGINQVWKWALHGDLQLSIAEDQLTQRFYYATREDGLDIDKFAFAKLGDGFSVGFTAAQLEAGEEGEPVYPPELPPAFQPPADQQPLAQGLNKWLGGVCCGSQRDYFENYFNQLTPENAGKWGSVEGTRDEYNWTALDEARDIAVENNFPFRFHVLAWGNQQPSWIEDLPQADQLEEIREWFEALNERYGNDIDFLEVVNEFDNDPPNQAGSGGGNYIEALGGTGDTGYDWIITLFRMANEIFPEHVQFMLNEYSVVNSDERTNTYIEVVELLQAEDLIDAIGVQGHAFSTRGAVSTMTNNINRLGATGLPVYITEMDIDGPTAMQQLIDYVRLFPAFWENPNIQGITLWGYKEGMWRENEGATLVYSNGAEKPALRWLKGYLKGTAPVIKGPPSINVNIEAPANTVIAEFMAETPDGTAYPADAVVSWGIVDGDIVDAVALDKNTGSFQITQSLTAGTYNLRIYVDIDATLSALYNIELIVE